MQGAAQAPLFWPPSGTRASGLPPPSVLVLPSVPVAPSLLVLASLRAGYGWQVPGRSGSRHSWAQPQMLAPWQVPTVQSESIQQVPAAGGGTHTPAPPEVQLAPTQRAPLRQSPAVKQQPIGATMVHMQAPSWALLTPAERRLHSLP